MAKIFNLETRLLQFSKNIISICKTTKITQLNKNIIDQLLRSSTSIGANYSEANDALGKKDFLFRLRIARKECKETIYWLKLFQHESTNKKIDESIAEAKEIRNILSAIIIKAS